MKDAKLSHDVFCKKEALKLVQQCYKELRNFEQAYKYLEEYNSLVAESDNALLRNRLEYHGMRNELALERARADDQRQRSEVLRIELDHKEREVTEQIRHRLKQAEALKQFRDDLRALIRRSSPSDPLVKEFRDKLKDLPEDEIDWLKFESQFTELHPEFKPRLQERYPELSKMEIKVSQLARLGLKTHEMARLLSLSERTIDSHRNSVRRKLGIKPSDNLSEFLYGIK